MKFERVSLFFYSPTGTTHKIASEIAAGTGTDPLKVIENNLTYPEFADSMVEVEPNDLVIIGAPVYAGRIASEALKRLATIKFAQNPAILLAVYGNRNYDDALIDLREAAKTAGLRPVAAAAFIGEHSYSTRKYPIAKGRPDDTDKQAARNFGSRVYEKIQSLADIVSLPELSLPGRFPLPDRIVIPPSPAETIVERCVECGKCQTACPTGAVYYQKGYKTKTELCTICCACLKACPHDARVIRSEHVQKFREMLATSCSNRREPEVFI